MKRHAKKQHGGLDRLFCIACPDLNMFSTAKALARHAKTHLPAQPCSSCGECFKASYINEHKKQCNVQCAIDESHASSTEPRPEKLYRAPKMPTLTRSPHLAPTQGRLEEHLPDFVDWINNPLAYGKTTSTSSTVLYLNKFRTTIGKWSASLSMSSTQLLLRLQNPATCVKLLQPAALNKLLQDLGTASNGRKLKISTVYNYVQPLIQFLEWGETIRGVRALHSAKENLKLLGKSFFRNKKKERMQGDVEDRFAKLPNLDALSSFVVDELRPKMLKMKADGLTDPWTRYMTARDYMLGMTLINIPPQRKQILASIKVDTWGRYKDAGRFYVAKHKTAHVYGDVNIVYPAHVVPDVETYLHLRRLVAKPDVKELFVAHDGQADKYITSRFQVLMDKKFFVNVTVKDCRNIFINHASNNMDPAGLEALARQMAHSYSTQQSVYRSDQAISRSYIVTQQAQDLPALSSMA